MIFGSCGKCSATNLPVKDGELVAHMSKGKPCDWAIPLDAREGLDIPFVNNPHLSFFENMSTMLDLLER